MSTNTRMPAGRAVRMLSARRTAYFAYAAGATGVLADLFLIALYVQLGLQTGSPEAQTPLGLIGDLAGAASDLLGSLATAFMIPVALFLLGRLPGRRAVRLTQAAGLTAMALLTAGGSLLVFRVLAFDVQTPIAMAAWIILCVWLWLTNQWLRLSDALRSGWHGSGSWWCGLVGRIRNRWARSLAAVDVVAAACSVRRRPPDRASRLPRHASVVRVPGPTPWDPVIMSAGTKLRSPSLVAQVTSKTIFR